MENRDNKEKSKKDQEDEQNSNSGGSDETSDESVPDESSDAPATPNPKYLVQYNAQNGLGPDPVPGKHGLTENPNYVPDTVPRKKACEFSPANCYCGARPTQQMDLLCASKKRAYCGWFCKHKMGGREGKPKLGPDQYGGNAPPKLKPEKRANPMGCPKPSLQTCEAIYSDPNSPDYVGDGYAPPGANCVCHIDQKTGHAVITDLPNSAALPGANKPAAAGAPAPGAPAATQPAAGAATGPATSGAPAEAANSNGAGPDSGNAANPAAAAINGAANDAVQGIQAAQQTANAAGQAAAQTAQAA